MMCRHLLIQWNLSIMDTFGPAKSVQIIKVSRFSRSVYIIMGPQLSVWIMQASTFSSVLINRFHCTLNRHLSCSIALTWCSSCVCVDLFLILYSCFFQVEIVCIRRSDALGRLC